jgi:hypothetical protein
MKPEENSSSDGTAAKLDTTVWSCSKKIIGKLPRAMYFPKRSSIVYQIGYAGCAVLRSISACRRLAFFPEFISS